MRFVVMSVFVAGAAAAMPTMAQEMPLRSNFTGPRVEARIGWDRPTIRGTISDGTGSISRSKGRNGVGYGGEVGYDVDLHGIVVGAYAGVAGSSAKSCGELYGEDELCIRAGRDMTAGARLGFAASESFMLYAKGGYSNGRASIDYRDFEAVLYDRKEGRSFGGLHAGAGLEATMDGGVYGRLEYVYTDFSGMSVSARDVRADVEPRRHQVVFGLGYRF